MFREALGIGRHGEKRVHGGFILDAVTLVDLFLTVGSDGCTIVKREGSGVGVEWSIVDLLAEKKEVGDAFLLFFRKGGGGRDIVGLD